MANYQSSYTGEQIDEAVKTIVANEGVSRQSLTSDGNGGVAWAHKTGLYQHIIKINGNAIFIYYSNNNYASKSYSDLHAMLKNCVLGLQNPEGNSLLLNISGTTTDGIIRLFRSEINSDNTYSLQLDDIISSGSVGEITDVVIEA